MSLLFLFLTATFLKNFPVFREEKAKKKGRKKEKSLPQILFSNYSKQILACPTEK